MRVIVLFLASIMSLPAVAATLVTPHYTVTIERHCAEGNVTCDDVTYTGKSRISGNAITLRGATWHTLCADGVTPCRFLGYRFKNGNVTYVVTQDGKLEVVRNETEVLISEEGNWR
ncbi:hypothetical protein SAMN05661010_01410 [Modicisalibacter muralis]|uniref:Uncharacterized protein n=1 Tax=Modicisalibacter muralis TaxID=119000 RepID=A0A1G9J132_9GAMM|nr:hypothetical protein [Halomonas muralis]SDL30913.1 hypothetical protein SAMN05661010_01410 [Halomonas muralis]